MRVSTMTLTGALAIALAGPAAIAVAGPAALGAPAPARGKPNARPAVIRPAAPVSVPAAIVSVNTGRGQLVRLAQPMTDLFIADDGIADVQVRSPTQLYIFGKKTGETTISATSKSGAVVYAATVRVGTNLNSVGQMLSLAMPEAQITATPMNGMVLLTGTVAAPDDAAEAERLVQAFVGDSTKVLSRLKTATPLQVNLQVRFAEVSRSFIKNVGVRLNTSDRAGSGFLFGSNSGNAGTITYDAATGGKTSTYSVGTQRSTLGIAGRLFGTDILSAIDLGETIGQVTTLANPNLTALSGETGTFLAGGEVPIPIAQALGTISVEYKQYGVSLSYTPIVLSDGRISLRVRPEVSQLDYSNAITMNGTRVPGLTSRRAETTVELGSGQSVMIGGLLQNSHNNSIEKTPFLGDLPILGSLFRSNAFQRNETELVIIITPYLVKPVNSSSDIALPTDGYRAPTDAGRILGGQLSAPYLPGTPIDRRPVPTMAPQTDAAPAIGATATVPAVPVPQGPVGEDRERALPASSKKGSSVMPGFSR